MKILGIIPVRYNSTRFPGKPLVNINGKTMIQRVYQQAKRCQALTKLYIATDSKKIFLHAKTFTKNVIMTGPHNSGTERCNAVYQTLETAFDLVINIQGDEPFINHKQISQVINCFNNDEVIISTLAKKIEDINDLSNKNIVKVFFDEAFFVKGFSRLPPHKILNINVPLTVMEETFYKHIGIYGFRTISLKNLCDLQPTKNELKSKLEQIRWLENGYSIKVGITEHESISIDNPEDLNKLGL